METTFEFLGLFGMHHHSAILPPFLLFLLHPTMRTNINNLCFVCSTLFIEKFNNRVARTRTLMRNRLLRFDSPLLRKFNCYEKKKDNRDNRDYLKYKEDLKRTNMRFCVEKSKKPHIATTIRLECMRNFYIK